MVRQGGSEVRCAYSCTDVRLRCDNAFSTLVLLSYQVFKEVTLGAVLVG